MPRVPRVHCNRLNIPADIPIPFLYYKRSVGIPFIDILLQRLQNRFSANNCRPVSALLSLIPPLMVKLGMPPAGQFESRYDDPPTSRSLDNEVFIQMVHCVVQAV